MDRGIDRVITDLKALFVPGRAFLQREDVIGVRSPGCYRLRMTTPDLRDRELDLHRLDLRYADLRLADPRALERLRQSLERYGQREPCLAVAPPEGPQLVLLDGYQRAAALRCLGRDTVRVEARAVDLTAGLILALTRARDGRGRRSRRPGGCGN